MEKQLRLRWLTLHFLSLKKRGKELCVCHNAKMGYGGGGEEEKGARRRRSPRHHTRVVCAGGRIRRAYVYGIYGVVVVEVAICLFEREQRRTRAGQGIDLRVLC